MSYFIYLFFNKWAKDKGLKEVTNVSGMCSGRGWYLGLKLHVCQIWPHNQDHCEYMTWCTSKNSLGFYQTYCQLQPKWGNYWKEVRYCTKLHKTKGTADQARVWREGTGGLGWWQQQQLVNLNSSCSSLPVLIQVRDSAVSSHGGLSGSRTRLHGPLRPSAPSVPPSSYPAFIFFTVVLTVEKSVFASLSMKI